MSALRQPGPKAVHVDHHTSTKIFNMNLSSLTNDSTLSRYIHEQPSVSSHLSLGNSGYQTLKSQSKRLILDDFDEIDATFGGCDCCQTEGAHDMRSEIEDIVGMDHASENRR